MSIPYSEEETIKETMGYSVTESGILEFDECWPEVEPGEYKLVKSAILPGDNKEYTFSVNFVID